MATLYAARGGSQTTSDLYTVDPATGTCTSVGPIGFAVTGLAFDPTDGTLYGVTSNNSASSPRHLITIDPATGAGTDVGALGQPPGDICFDSTGVLYGFTTPSGTQDLVTINKSTGAASVVGDSGLSSTFGEGLGCDPSDVLWLFPFGGGGTYYTVNPSTGAVTSQGTLSGLGSMAAVAFDSLGTCYAIKASGFTSTLQTIDTATGAVTVIGTMSITEGDALTWDTVPTVPPPGNDDYPQNVSPGFESQDYWLNFNAFRSGGCQDFTNAGATPEAGEPDAYPGLSPNRTVWVTWDASFTGQVTAWLSSSDPGFTDGVMSVYDWVFSSPPSGLGAALDQGDDDIGNMPSVTFSVTNGNRYIFQIDCRDTDGGAFTFHWKRSDGTPPSNDDFASAALMSGLGGELSGTFATATAECDEPARLGETSGGSGPYNTVWYKWTPSASGTGMVRVIDWSGSYTDQGTGHTGAPFVDVFTGSSLASLTPVATAAVPGLKGDAQSRSFSITAGTTYYVRLDSGENLTSPTFTLVWETDLLDWRMKVGTFTAGTTSVSTGLGQRPAAIIVFAAGIGAGSFSNDSVWGLGASDGTSQWSAGYGFQRLINGDLTNGQQVEQTLFSTSNIVSVPQAVRGGGIYAQAALTAVADDGSFTLSWSTNPGDSSLFGYIVISGIEAAIGTTTFASGATHTTTLTPGIRTRALFGASVADAPSAADGWTATGWTEEQSTATDYNYGVGVKTGISWYGPNNDDGDFQVASPDWLRYAVSASQAAKFSGATSFSLEHTNSAYDVSFGWIALGGFGWHAWNPNHENNVGLATNGFDGTTFWVRGGLSFGVDSGVTGSGNWSSEEQGAFDRSDNQFAVTQFYLSEADIHNTHADTARTADTGKVLLAQDSLSTTSGSWATDLPNDDTTFGGTATKTGTISTGGLLALLGHFLLPHPALVGNLVSFSAVTMLGKQATVSVRG